MHGDVQNSPTLPRQQCAAPSAGSIPMIDKHGLHAVTNDRMALTRQIAADRAYRC
jgi:hypothetical protein